MSTARHYLPHYTVADYEQWEGDWELWNGVPVAMSPAPTPRHQQVVLDIAVALRQGIQSAGCSDCLVLIDVDWQLESDTVLRPDVAVICQPLPAVRLIDPPALIVEVLSPSTINKDRTAKFALYEDQGVMHYWIADPLEQRLEAWRLVDGEYRAVTIEPRMQVRLSNDCEIDVALEPFSG